MKSSLLPPAPYASAWPVQLSRSVKYISEQRAVWAIRLTTHRPFALSLISFVALLTYYFGLFLPYNIFTIRLRPAVNIAKLTQGDPIAQAQFVLTFAGLSALYYLTWRLCRGVQTRAVWLVVVVTALACNLVMLWLYPIGAADIFDNIMRGRITAFHGGNPFYNTPADFQSDAIYYFTAWRTATSAYGPLWEVIAAGVSRLAGNDRLANVIGFKLVGILFYFGCAYLIAVILRRHAPERALQGVCLFALNPLVIYETAGNGHNDIAMAFFIVFGLYALINGRGTLAALAVTAGVLIKFIPALILPIVIVASLRIQPTWPGRVRHFLTTGFACASLVIILYAPFWKGGDILALKRRETMFTASLPALIQVNLEPAIGRDESRRIVTNGAILLTGLAVLAAMWRTWVEMGESQWVVPIKASTIVLLVYLLFTCLWFQSWYALWPLALAALLPEGESGRIAVLLSYSALWKTIIFDFFLYTGGQLPPRLWRETRLGPAMLGVTWSYGVYAAVKRGFQSPILSTVLKRDRAPRMKKEPMSNALIVVAKRPAAGQTKTRLSPPLSPEQAAQLYEHFLRDTLDLMRQVPQTARIIAYSPEGEEAYFKLLAPDFDLVPQRGSDLGERLDNALTHCLLNGCDKAVIMDSDSPTLPASFLIQAFVALDMADVVLGPCEDGGYYLIGLKRPAPRLLREVRMSTATVLRDTLVLAEAEGLKVAQLPTWYDVDTALELERLQIELAALAIGSAFYSQQFLRRLSTNSQPAAVGNSS